MTKELGAAGIRATEGMGSYGRIASLDDLPSTRELDAQIRKAASLIEDGARTRSLQRVAKPARPEAVVPEVLAQALKSNKMAAARFKAMSPSCRREYADWINDAKREETRSKRVATAVEWIAEGKSRNWKYETC